MTRGSLPGKSTTYPGLVVALSLVELFIVLLMLAFVVKPNPGFLDLQQRPRSARSSDSKQTQAADRLTELPELPSHGAYQTSSVVASRAR